jgi:hypothetical protein
MSLFTIVFSFNIVVLVFWFLVELSCYTCCYALLFSRLATLEASSCFSCVTPCYFSALCLASNCFRTLLLSCLAPWCYCALLHFVIHLFSHLVAFMPCTLLLLCFATLCYLIVFAPCCYCALLHFVIVPCFCCIMPCCFCTLLHLFVAPCSSCIVPCCVSLSHLAVLNSQI